MRPRNFKYRSDLLHPVLTIECRSDRLGNVFYYVTFTSDVEHSYAFQYLSSAIDFVNSNFNKDYALF